MMKNLVLLSILLCWCTTGVLEAQNVSGKEEWIQLFNGKDLTGWIPKIKGFKAGDNYKNTFRVEGGILKADTRDYDNFDNHFGHLFYVRPFSFYRIRVEYRFFEPQAKNGPQWARENSGIMIHCQPPETMGINQDFPISIEVQLLADDGSGTRPDANVCTPGTNIVMHDSLITEHCVTSTAKTHKPGEWTTVEAVVLGGSLIEHYVNGEKVLSYTMPQVGGEVVNDYYDWAKPDGKLLTGGYISLQSESQPVEFRKVELLNLEGCMDPKAKNYKSYYVKDNRNSCVY